MTRNRVTARMVKTADGDVVSVYEVGGVSVESAAAVEGAVRRE